MRVYTFLIINLILIKQVFGLAFPFLLAGRINIRPKVEMVFVLALSSRYFLDKQYINTQNVTKKITKNYLQVSQKIAIIYYGKNLLCGSALCGGSAYALLERFFRNYVTFIGENGTLQYESINELALKAYENGERPLSVTTTFCGTRSDPKRRGSIENIDLFNFTPSALALGVIHGMCDELYRLYQAMHIKKTHIVASCGAVRKNSVLRSVLQDMLGLNVSVCAVKEGVATGVALFSALALGKIGYNDGFSDFINYV